MSRNQKFSNIGRKKRSDMLGAAENEIVEGVPDAILKQARKSGQLNLSNRSLTSIPDKVWRINVDVPEESKTAALDGAEDRWWEQTDLNKLILASNKLTSLPSEIQQLPALVVLDVHDNDISDISGAIGELVNLKRLNLSYNKMTSLPSQIGHLTSLASLLLQHNQLNSLIDTIGNLQNLEELDVSNNKIEVLPSSAGSLKSLRKLNLSNNALTRLPPQFGDLSVLSDLNLSNNKLQELPTDFGNLKTLERLDCRYNQLTSVPFFKSCQQLKELYLGYNHITSIGGKEIAGIESVVVFDIRDNKISIIPVDIATMVKLERLDLSNNNLSGLPYEMGNMGNLKSVVLDGNPLRSIRRDIIMKGTVALLKHLKNKIPENEPASGGSPEQEASPSLTTHSLNTNKTLSYSKQKASTIPENIWEAATGIQITSIDFSKNLLQEVPLRLCKFEETLTSVNLSSNKISKLPPELSLLSRLTYLDVSNNSLASLPEEFKLLVELREIIVSSNRFSNLPDVLYSLSKLEVILASGNQIGVINVEGILKLKHLTSLDLSNNSIAVVPPELGNASNLRSLQLEGNVFRNPRLAILNKGTAALLDYLKDRIPT